MYWSPQWLRHLLGYVVVAFQVVCFQRGSSRSMKPPTPSNRLFWHPLPTQPAPPTQLVGNQPTYPRVEDSLLKRWTRMYIRSTNWQTHSAFMAPPNPQPQQGYHWSQTHNIVYSGVRLCTLMPVF